MVEDSPSLLDTAKTSDGAEATPSPVTAGDGSILGQTNSFAAAGAAAQQGAVNAGSVAVLECGKALNTVESDPAAAGALFQNCQNSLAAASQLHQMARADQANSGRGSDAASVSSITFSSPGAKVIFTELAAKYGVGQEEFTHQVAQSGGDIGAFTAQYGDKIPADKLATALASLQPSPLGQADASGAGMSSVNLAGGKLKGNANARESIHAKLRDALTTAESSATAKGSAASGNGRKPAQAEFKNLTPNFYGEAPVVATNTASVEELTLFDVVHRKYEERESILRYRGKNR